MATRPRSDRPLSAEIRGDGIFADYGRPKKDPPQEVPGFVMTARPFDHMAIHAENATLGCFSDAYKVILQD